MATINLGSFAFHFFLILVSSTAISVEETSIRTKAGSKVLLPCDISVHTAPPPLGDEEDSAQVILWFKDEGSLPIYAVDARQAEGLWEAKHWQPSEVNSRIRFNMNSSPAALLIQNVRKEDAGVYRCRVDFRHSRTRNSNTKLEIF